MARKRRERPQRPLTKVGNAAAEAERLIFEMRNWGIDIGVHKRNDMLTFRVQIARDEIEADEGVAGNGLLALLLRKIQG